jgi:transcriptional regulator with XRE-family HTH domain
MMTSETVDTKRWRRAAGRYREIMRQSEWFRASLEYHCRESGRGTQAELSRDVGYNHQSMVSNILKGIRTPDFKQAVKIAYYFGTDILKFIEIGRDLVEYERTPPQRWRLDRQVPRKR